jgi:alkylation response protein AidB-like acyl-CoA dehydrogenase
LSSSRSKHSSTSLRRSPRNRLATPAGTHHGRGPVGRACRDHVGLTSSAELFFDDVRVGVDSVIGSIDQGFFHMMDLLPQERLNAAIANLAHAQSIFAETIEYCGSRKAFGAAIGSFQHNKFTLAELDTQLRATQSFLDDAIRATTGATSPRSMWRGRSGGPQTCRTACWTPACSFTGATAT